VDSEEIFLIYVNVNERRIRLKACFLKTLSVTIIYIFINCAWKKSLCDKIFLGSFTYLFISSGFEK